MIKLNISKRERYIFIILVSIIGAGILYNFILEPIFKRWSGLNNEITAKHDIFKKDLEILKTRDAIIEEYNSYASSIKNASAILNYIENEAQISGVEVVNIRPMPADQEELYKEYKIELRIEGDISNINKFLTSLMKPQVLITVKTFNLTASIENPSQFKGTLILSKLII